MKPQISRARILAVWMSWLGLTIVIHILPFNSFARTCHTIFDQASTRLTPFTEKQVDQLRFGMAPKGGPGFAILQGRPILSPAEIAKIRKKIFELSALGEVTALFNSRSILTEDFGAEIAEKIDYFVHQLIEHLAAVEGRSLSFRLGGFRVEEGAAFSEGHIHEFGWITVTHALQGDGTFLVPYGRNKLSSSAGDIVVFSDGDRALDLNIRGGPIFHGTPPLGNQPRLLLLLSFDPATAP